MCSQYLLRPGVSLCDIFLGVSDLWDWVLNGYTPIEYIECTGTQWIDTGIDTTPFDISFATKIYYPNGGERTILGNNDESVFDFYVDDNIISLYNGDRTGWIIFTNMAVNTIHVVEGTMSTGGLSLTVDGVKKESAITTKYGNRRLRLFQHHGLYKYIGRLYYMQISIGGELVRDFIPVRFGQFGCLYDKVSGRFFANQGTGNFVLGPDL